MTYSQVVGQLRASQGERVGHRYLAMVDKVRWRVAGNLGAVARTCTLAVVDTWAGGCSIF